MSEKKTVNLTFDGSLSGLAGNPYGKKVYSEQVGRRIKIGEDVVFVFPKNIVRVASSFVQGFFHEWLETVGVEGIKRHVTIKGASEEFSKMVFENLT